MENPRNKFSEIYDKYIDKIYRFVFLKVNSEEIAQDLTSETFVRGWEAFKKSTSPKERKIDNPGAFLYQIARNLVVDYYREKGRTQNISIETTPISDPRSSAFEDKIILESEVGQIKIALANLKDEYQNVIIWRYLDGLSVKEIAKIMDKTEENTRVLLHRALQSLKEKLNPTEKIKEI